LIDYSYQAVYKLQKQKNLKVNTIFHEANIIKIIENNYHLYKTLTDR